MPLYEIGHGVVDDLAGGGASDEHGGLDILHNLGLTLLEDAVTTGGLGVSTHMSITFTYPIFSYTLCRGSACSVLVIVGGESKTVDGPPAGLGCTPPSYHMGLFDKPPTPKGMAPM